MYIDHKKEFSDYLNPKIIKPQKNSKIMTKISKIHKIYRVKRVNKNSSL